MVGYGQMTEVMLWVQTKNEASVQFRYWPAGDAASKRLSPSVVTKKQDALTAHITLTDLKPGTKYEYEVLINRKVEKRPYPLRFQTQPLWQWRADPPDFTVAFGSCAYMNEAEFDRPGKPYGSNFQIFSVMAKQNPDVMLWLGDNVYYREADWNSVSGQRYRYTHSRSLPELQPLLGATHHYATWDDHDYGPDDSNRSYRLKFESLETFKLFWANQTYGTEDTRGVFQKFEWGDVEFFMLDDRYHRSPNNSPDDESETMFGQPQLQWLMDGLSSSFATFKVIVNGNQMLNPFHYFEALSGYQRDYNTVLSFIKERKISGVFFLSGDRHFTELLRLQDSTFYPLYDFTCSPLTAGLSGPKDREANSPYRVPGTGVTDAQNFGLLRFTGKRTDRKAILECWDYTGKQRWTFEIKASDLKAPASK
jgi:alkaline phosphatase D